MDPSQRDSSRERLAELFERQRQAFRRMPYPDLQCRLAHLETLQKALFGHGDAIARAISEDFGNRSSHETRLLELFTSLDELRQARRHLRRWMKPERRRTSVWFLPGRSRLFKQPLGVVGIIVPWNYPLFLAVSPLVSALSAGNHAMVKMSELAPSISELFASIIREHFDEDHLAVVNGGPEVAQAFSGLPFDHLLFTGSTSVGALVMKSASRNLTPVTLELGGKSPAIVAPEFPVKTAACRIIFGKCLNSGQTCIAPDYVMVPEGSQETFLEAAREEVVRLYPSVEQNPDYSSIINQRHFERLVSYLEEARRLGARVVNLHPTSALLHPAARKIAPVAILDTRENMRVMQDEIFGPLLPVVPYRDLSDALQYVNGHPRPLALYYFDNNSTRVRRVLRETIAGGVTINDTMLHTAQDDLPFGGVGPSGMGHYHGREGFETFSKKKAVFFQSRFNGVGLLKPPYGKRFDRMLKWMTPSIRS